MAEKQLVQEKKKVEELLLTKQEMHIRHAAQAEQACHSKAVQYERDSLQSLCAQLLDMRPVRVEKKAYAF